MKILEIETCDNCYLKAKFSDRCLHNDTFNKEIDKSHNSPIPEWCPLQDKGLSFPIDIKHSQVIAFAKAMDEVLCKNDYKGGWQDCDINYLRFRLMEEIGEYFAWQASDTDACGDKITAEEWREKNKDRVKKELVDIANFCLMLWDRELR